MFLPFVVQDKGFCPVRPGAEEVKLKCDPRIEAGYFNEVEPMFIAIGQIAKICDKIPVHVIFGHDTDLT